MTPTTAPTRSVRGALPAQANDRRPDPDSSEKAPGSACLVWPRGRYQLRRHRPPRSHLDHPTSCPARHTAQRRPRHVLPALPRIAGIEQQQQPPDAGVRQQPIITISPAGTVRVQQIIRDRVIGEQHEVPVIEDLPVTGEVDRRLDHPGAGRVPQEEAPQPVPQLRRCRALARARQHGYTRLRQEVTAEQVYHARNVRCSSCRFHSAHVHTGSSRRSAGTGFPPRASISPRLSPSGPVACRQALPDGPAGLHARQVRPGIVSGRAVIHHPAVHARPERHRAGP